MNKIKEILIIGSTNTDMVVRVDQFPKPGETIFGYDFIMDSGGKGANQAVAVARLGGKVTFVGKIGKDLFGEETLRKLKSEDIDVSHVAVDDEAHSGIALITVDEKAENHIVVASGANAKVLFEDTTLLNELITSDKVVLLQLEIPLETIEQVCQIASTKGATVILNPAPSRVLNDRILKLVDVITPNQEEAKFLSGIEVVNAQSALEAAKIIHERGPKNVIITMGDQGAFIYGEGLQEQVSSYHVEPKDTTAAGDVFNGAIAVSLSEGRNLLEAVYFGCRASAITVTRPGAQASIPKLEEVIEFEKKNG